MANKAKKTYLSAVEKHLQCDKHNKKKLIDFLENTIDLLAEEKDDLTFDKLVDKLGDPKKVAFELEGTISEDEHKKYLKKAIKLKKVVVTFLLMLFIVFAIWLVGMFVDANKANNGHFEENLEIITQNNYEKQETII